MEYFDFDGASHGSYAQEDDAASNSIEVDETDVVAELDSLRHEQPLEFQNDPPEQMQNVANEEAQDAMNPPMENIYPMFRAPAPCDFCRSMGFDCFVAKRGVMQNGCTCCISLYKECSFTHAKTPGKYLDTLHPVSENVDIPTGSMTGKRALKSLTGATMSEDADGRFKKANARFSREAVRILRTWLSDHSLHPYPSEQEKDELKERTGLTRAQISNWLANARRRGKVPSVPRSSSPVPKPVDIPGQSPEMEYMTPMERWKHSPPEHEPAATSDILRALVNTPIDSAKQRSSPANHVRSYSRRTGSSNDSSHGNSNRIQASSGSSRETSRSSISDLSFTSAFSHRSSLGSMERKDRRRRRRRPSPAVNTFNQQKARNARIFQCTFCAESFPTKYDWQRHEKSLHLALEKWTCSPAGGVVNMNGTDQCVFCLAPHPDADHLESHNYSACQEKTPQERTFYRKDHLNQHLRLMHNVKFNASMNQWRSSTSDIVSRCGFCGTIFGTWKDRVDHLASHFKHGADMSQWQGDWGFEPVVQNLVENAMPPYLIAQDRKTLDPFNASEVVVPSGDSSEPRLVVPDDANCFFRLERELTAFIRNQTSVGVVPTDLMIQNQARQIIYGCDDPWNQTCADNPVWLSVLKRDVGMEAVPHSDHIQFDNLGMQAPFALHGGLRRPPAETNPFAKAVCRGPLRSPSGPSSGAQSPAFFGTGRSSAAASMPGSGAGSYVSSPGVFSAARPPGLTADWGSGVSTQASSSSVPASAPADPLAQMGFDPVFLQQLNDSYGELDQDMEGLTFGDVDSSGGSGPGPPAGIEDMPDAPGEFLPDSNMASAPMAIPNHKQPNIPVTDASQQNLAPLQNQPFFNSDGV